MNDTHVNRLSRDTRDGYHEARAIRQGFDKTSCRERYKFVDLS